MVSDEQFERLSALVHVMRWHFTFLRRELIAAGVAIPAFPLQTETDIEGEIDSMREGLIGSGLSAEIVDQRVQILRDASAQFLRLDRMIGP